MLFLNGTNGLVTNLLTWVNENGGIIVTIGLVLGVIKFVYDVISSNGQAMKTFFAVLVAAFVWFGFNTIVGDMQSTGGGGNGGYTSTVGKGRGR